jgi:hypothetical protein
LYAYIRLSEPFCRALTVNCKIYMPWEREDSSTWILDNPSVWIHLTTEAEADRQTRRGASVWQLYILKLIRTHPNYSTSVTC